MRCGRNLTALVLALILAVPAVLTGCEKPERGDGMKKSLPDFYNGMEVTPIYSRSRVEQDHIRHEFPPVLQGDIVHHDFIIENSGAEPLEITKAAGCCGFIVESHAKRIDPGRTGNISVLILTDSRGGQEISGTITAETSDPRRPRITIDAAVTVLEFAALHPYRIWLTGKEDAEIVETCMVVPNADFPFRITGIKVRKGVWFDYDWRETEFEGRRAYAITVRNTRKKPGPYQDVLFVQTDHPRRPEFRIRVEGRIGENMPAPPTP